MKSQAKLLHDYLRITARRHGDKNALICGAKRRTYREIDEKSDQLASCLHKLGLAPRDKVAVLLDNSAETVISLYGISKASGVFVIANATLKASKLAYILKDSGARTLITHTSKAKVVAQALEQLDREIHLIWISPLGKVPPKLLEKYNALAWDSIFSDPSASKAPPPPASTGEHDLAALIYTSGSTGRPKGVMQPHSNMIDVAKCIIDYLKNTEDDIILNVLSLAFGYGMYQVLMAFMFGGTVVLEKSFVYLHKILKRIEEERVTGFPFVPTVIAMMFQLEGVEQYDFASLRYVTNAGAALPVDHARKLRKLLPQTSIYPMYGLTECVRVSYLEPNQVDKRPDSVGKALAVCQTLIVDQNGKPACPGQTGELLIRGSNVMPGYWNDPDLTDKVFRRNHDDDEIWLYSGDLFRRDEEGFLYFVSRKDDMIKTRGERVSPGEVENALVLLSGVAEVAVIGVPDDILGQVIKAFIVPEHKDALSENDVLKYSAKCMENYMVPKHVVFLDSLPKTPNGKIDKKLLKNQQENNNDAR